MGFEPRILGFACNWCAYAAADLAGVIRMQYPTNIRLIRVMCSGMVHPRMIVKAFASGADGVLVMGCNPGECHYVEGIFKAKARARVVEEVIEVMGIERERFQIVWCSAVEVDKFVEAVTSMTEKIKQLGPSLYNRKTFPNQIIRGKLNDC